MKMKKRGKIIVKKLKEKVRRIQKRKNKEKIIGRE
jgi:hypothetical protein